MDLSLAQVKGIGPARLKSLKAAGIETVRQLLMCLPREYRDLSEVKPLGSLMAGDTAAVFVRVLAPLREHRAGKLLISKTFVGDESDRMTVVFYNQPWLKQQLQEGTELLLYGRVEARYGELQLVSPTIEQEQTIRPVYRSVPGVQPKVFAQCVQAALSMLEGQWPDELPESLRLRYGLCERNFAMRNAHTPESKEALTEARRRLSFEELLLYQVGLWILRGSGMEGVQIPCDTADTQAFWQTLPFPPTGAQVRVLDEIAIDLAARQPMARLVQGDVGCGKTAIAFGALAIAAQNGWQSAMMAPTEILAQQHYESAQTLLEPLGIRCGLLTGSMTAKQHREAHRAIKEGEWQVTFGTHALITPAVEYQNLGLVVTDEQHRFGVKQRTSLSMKGDSPNVLVMSATPIPRTLSLILFGDLDISIVDELPPGRTPVKTRIVPASKRMDMYGFLRKEAQAGRQIYVVCPLVEESEAIDALPAEAVYEELRTKYLADLRIGLVHGRMKPADKEQTLNAFHHRDLDVLVSTTVIEVGVNVPNASVMVIENAERFGLAQLHQLRGRVGRGANVSWCFLMAESNEKLKLLTETNDGFLIAQKDMEIRGPGELFGYRQSGVATIGIGSAAADTALLKESHDAARDLLKRPDSDETKQVIVLAKDVLNRQLNEIAMN